MGQTLYIHFFVSLDVVSITDVNFLEKINCHNTQIKSAEELEIPMNLKGFKWHKLYFILIHTQRNSSR